MNRPNIEYFQEAPKSAKQSVCWSGNEFLVVLPRLRECFQFARHAWERLLALNPMLILNEQVRNRNLVELPTGEVMLHEKIASRPNQPPLANGLSPEVIIKRLPVRCIQCLLSFTKSSCAQEDIVSQQVRWKKRFASRIQGFK